MDRIEENPINLFTATSPSCSSASSSSSPSLIGTTFNLEPLETAFNTFKGEYKELAKARVANNSKALAAAKHLVEITDQLQQSILLIKKTSDLRTLFAENEFHSFAFQMTKLLSRTDLRPWMKLTRPMSEATRVFVELALFQSAIRAQGGANIPPKDILLKLDIAYDALPIKEVAARSNIERAQVAARRLNDIVDRPRKSYGTEESTPSKSIEEADPKHSPPPIVHLAYSIYKYKDLAWCRDIYELKEAQLNNKITTIDQFNKLSHIFGRFGTNRNLAICITDILIGILKDSDAKNDLKQEVLFGEKHASLQRILNFRWSRLLPGTDRDGFWSARYYALKKMSSIYQADPSVVDSIVEVCFPLDGLGASGENRLVETRETIALARRKFAKIWAKEPTARIQALEEYQRYEQRLLKCSRNQRLAPYVIELFEDIVSNPGSCSKLRERVIDSPELCLGNMASFPEPALPRKGQLSHEQIQAIKQEVQAVRWQALKVLDRFALDYPEITAVMIERILDPDKALSDITREASLIFQRIMAKKSPQEVKLFRIGKNGSEKQLISALEERFKQLEDNSLSSKELAAELLCKEIELAEEIEIGELARRRQGGVYTVQQSTGYGKVELDEDDKVRVKLLEQEAETTQKALLGTMLEWIKGCKPLSISSSST